MLLWAALAGLAILMHTAPFRFVLDHEPTSVWMPEMMGAALDPDHPEPAPL